MVSYAKKKNKKTKRSKSKKANDVHNNNVLLVNGKKLNNTRIGDYQNNGRYW